MSSPAARRQAAQGLVSKGWSQRRACALVGLARGSYHPVAHGRNDEPVRQALRALSGRHPGWGFWKLHHRLRKNGLVINHKRTLRIYRALALNLPRRLKKRVPRAALNGARGRQRVLVARLYERRVDRWPPVPDPERARRL